MVAFMVLIHMFKPFHFICVICFDIAMVILIPF